MGVAGERHAMCESALSVHRCKNLRADRSYKVYFVTICWSIVWYIFVLNIQEQFSTLFLNMYRGADKSLARPEWKNKWKVAIFRPTQSSLLPRRSGWTDNHLNFFWVACKSLSLVPVSCFLPCRSKDLSAPRYTYVSPVVSFLQVFFE